MKIKSAALVSAILATGLWANTAFAAPVSLEVSSASWNIGSGWGAACATSTCDTANTQLNVDWTFGLGLVGTTLTFNQVNDFKTITLGSAKFSEENDSIDTGEVDNLNLSALLQFKSFASASTSNAAVIATLGALKDRGNNDDLVVNFAPIQIQLTDGSLLDVVFSGLSWNCQGNNHCTWQSPVSQNLNATFTLTKVGSLANAQALVNNVPEPSSMLLFAAGIAGLGFTRRRKAN